MEQGRRKMREEVAEREGERGSSAGKGRKEGWREMRGGGTDGVRKGKGKAGMEQKTGGDEGWGERRKSGVLRWTGRGDWLFGFDSMCQIDCG